MNVFEITLKQQLKMLARTIIFPIIMLLFVWYYELFNVFVFIPLGVLLVVDTLPSILLHINYYKANEGATLIIDQNHKVLIYKSKEKFFETSLSNISCMCLTLSTVYNTGRHSFGQYRYCKVVLIDRTEIVISCLMVNDLENNLKNLLNVEPLIDRKLLCFIR